MLWDSSWDCGGGAALLYVAHIGVAELAVLISVQSLVGKLCI